MKVLDDVRVIRDRKEYADNEIYAGMVGTIVESAILFGECFFVIFSRKDIGKGDVFTGIKVEDLELVKDNNVDDKVILKELTEIGHPDCWCKVEDGYIKNLKGERKNKIPYKYDS